MIERLMHADGRVVLVPTVHLYVLFLQTTSVLFFFMNVRCWVIYTAMSEMFRTTWRTTIDNVNAAA